MPHVIVKLWPIRPDGLTDFEALRRRGAGAVAVLYAFDLLELDGDDLRNLPIETRKATLASLLRKIGHAAPTVPRCSLTPASWAPRVSCQSGSALPIAPARTRHG